MGDRERAQHPDPGTTLHSNDGRAGDDSDSIFQSLFTGGIVVFAGEMIGLVLSFLSSVIIGRLLGPDGYGAIALGATIITATSTFVLFGMHTGIGRYLPRYDDESSRRGVLVSAFQIALPLAALAGAGVAVFAEPIAVSVFGDANLTPVLRIFGVTIPIAALEKLTVGGIQGLQLSAPKVYIENFTAHGVRLLAAVSILAAGYQIVGVSWAYLLGHLAAAVLGLYYLYHRTNLFTRVEAVSMHRELFAFSAPLIISAIMGQVLSDIDTLLLGYFGSTADIGIYDVVYTMSTMLTVILASFSFVFMPVLSELHADEDHGEMKRIYQVVTKWVFLLSLPVGVVLVFFPDVVIRFTYGPEYLAGTTALSILAIGFFTHALAGPDYRLLTSIGETNLIMYDNVAAAAGNVVLNLALIPRYSFLGAAVATLLSYIALNIGYSVQLYRRTGIHPFSAGLVRPAAAMIPVVGAVGLAASIPERTTLPVFVVLFGAFLALYAGVVLRFGGIEREEIMLINRLESRLGIDLGPLKTAAQRLM